MEAGRRLRPERILPLDGVPVKDSQGQTVTLRLVNGDALTHDWAHDPPTQPAVAAAANIRQRASPVPHRAGTKQNARLEAGVA